MLGGNKKKMEKRKGQRCFTRGLFTIRVVWGKKKGRDESNDTTWEWFSPPKSYTLLEDGRKSLQKN
jgi:hypothetical protein